MPHARLKAQYDVEVTQADIGVDHHDRVAEDRQGRADVGGGRRLADAARPRGRRTVPVAGTSS